MYSHLRHFLIRVCFSGKLPHALMSQPHFENYYKTQTCSTEYFLHFTPIVVSFSAYLIIFTPDKRLLISQLTLTYLFNVHITDKTQTRFMVLFTSGSSLSWGNLQAPYEVSPPGICLLSILKNQLFTSLQRFYNDRI